MVVMTGQGEPEMQALAHDKLEVTVAVAG